MSQSAKKKEEQEEARETLRGWLPPGSTVYCILRNVSRSGMSRSISLHYNENGEPRWISYLAAKAADMSYDDKREAIRVGGCGMDMGFHVVSTLSAYLYPHGFGCIGDGSG